MIVPTYNEKDNLEELVTRIERACSGAGIETEIVIVDDNSPDGTGAEADELARSHRMKVIHRQGKLGLSSAVTEGFSAASGSDLVVMDADLSHPPEKIPAMVSMLESGEAEIVIGSRYVKGGSVENWPIRRRVISKGATLLARGLTKVRDPMSGFIALKRSVVEGVALDPIGYKIGLEILVKGKYQKVAEVPIHFANRKAGKSKLGGSEFLRYLDHVTRLYEHKRFWLAKYVKFAFIGGLGTIINLAVLWFSLQILGIHYLWGATIAFIVASTNNFIWNRWWTFKSKGLVHIQYTQFLLVSATGLALNLVLLWLLVERALPALGLSGDRANVYILISQVVAIFLVSIFNFGVNSLWTFQEDVKNRE